MKILSSSQIKEWDAYTMKHEPISSTDLMERAATACFDWILKRFSSQHFIILCGPGNNGGDGMVIARLLHQKGIKTTVYLLAAENYSSDLIVNKELLIDSAVTIHIIKNENNFPKLDNSIVVDALFGTGLNRPLTGIVEQLITYINDNAETIISIDLPSGMFADKCSINNPVIKATHTLSFECHKLAFMLHENSFHFGEVHILPIGLHKTYYSATGTPYHTIDIKDVKNIYSPRHPYSHKYNYGHALVFAGGKNMLGASILCSTACLRSGAGLVTIKTDETSQAVFQLALPEAITTSNIDLEKILFKKNAIAIGPGLELNDQNAELLEYLLHNTNIPMVIDASAITLLSEKKYMLEQSNNKHLILTPHTGEFDRLFGQSENDFERLQKAIDNAAAYNCHIVLKAHHTAIVTPDGNVYFNTTGNAGMATAGSGDVLTGIITGLLAQGYSNVASCLLGVYIHGYAGDIAAVESSEESMIAGDIIQNIGKVFKKIKG